MSDYQPVCGECNDLGRRALVTELVEGLKIRGHWVPEDGMSSKIIAAVFRAIDSEGKGL